MITTSEYCDIAHFLRMCHASISNDTDHYIYCLETEWGTTW